MDTYNPQGYKERKAYFKNYRDNNREQINQLARKYYYQDVEKQKERAEVSRVGERDLQIT